MIGRSRERYEARFLPAENPARDRLRDNAAIDGETPARETPMNDETFNMSIRKLLKMVGVSSQLAIERAAAAAIADGSIKGTETFPATMTLEVAGLKLSTTFNGDIHLQ